MDIRRSNTFTPIQEFEHNFGFVEGIGYRPDGRLVRYSAVTTGGPVVECEEISISEALEWWAELQADKEADSAAWVDEARSRFLAAAANAVRH